MYLLSLLPGMCVKTVSEPGMQKVFINICQSNSVPPPPDLSREELVELLQSEDPSGYRVPMTLGEPHTEIDNSTCLISKNNFFHQQTYKQHRKYLKGNHFFSCFMLLAHSKWKIPIPQWLTTTLSTYAYITGFSVVYSVHVKLWIHCLEHHTIPLWNNSFHYQILIQSVR